MRPVQREDIDKFARERAREMVRKAKKQAGPTLGTVEAARLLDTREIVFRGRAYSVAPIPWPLGSEILGILEAFMESPTPENFLPTAHLSHAVCRPVGFFRRLFWRFTNPFLRATRFEVGRNLGFFYMFHLLDNAGVEPRASKRGTSSRTSAGSPSTSKPGPARTAIRSPGAISSTRYGGGRLTRPRRSHA